MGVMWRILKVFRNGDLAQVLPVCLLMLEGSWSACPPGSEEHAAEVSWSGLSWGGNPATHSLVPHLCKLLAGILSGTTHLHKSMLGCYLRLRQRQGDVELRSTWLLWWWTLESPPSWCANRGAKSISEGSLLLHKNHHSNLERCPQIQKITQDLVYMILQCLIFNAPTVTAFASICFSIETNACPSFPWINLSR